MSITTAFRALDFIKPIQRARLAAIAVKEEIPKGKVIFQEGENSAYFYVLLSGEVELVNTQESHLVKKDHFFGTEVPCGIEQYLFTAITKSNCEVLKIAKNTLFEAIEPTSLQKFQKRFLQNFISTFYTKSFMVFKKDPIKQLLERVNRFWMEVIGWLMTAISPFIVFHYIHATTLNVRSQIFLCVLTSWSMILAFRLLSDHVATISIIFFLIAGQIIDTKVILAGFSSGNFIVALSLLGLSSVLVSSGITYRVIMYFLKIMKPSKFKDSLLLFGIGSFLTLGVPSYLVRSDMMRIFYQDIMHIRKLSAQTHTAGTIGFSAYCGIGLLSQGILSASMMHFVLLGLFWGQYVTQFDWSGWLYAALGPLAILLVGYFITLKIFFGKDLSIPYKDQCENQVLEICNILGKTSPAEIAAFLGLSLAILGLATTSLHNIPPHVVCLFILLFLLLFQFMNDKGFQTRIRWDFLIFICGLSGLTFTAKAIGLIGWLENHTKWLDFYINNYFFIMTTLMMGITIITQLILPRDININLLSVLFIPLFQKSGISPWIAVYIISTAGRMWFFEYQEPEFAHLLSQSRKAATIKRVKQARLVMNGFYILSIYLGIFYWKWIGIFS